MGDALFDLEQSLRSQKERLSPQEENIFQRCKSSALNQFTAGLIAGGGLVWAATWKLNRLLRVNLSSGAAIIVGFWRFGNSLESSVDRILALDGTRMQSELANIILKKYRDDPWKMRIISKHFYLEEVFDDSASGQRLRWRYRNFFGDIVDQDQGTHSDSRDVSHNATPNDIHNNFDRKKTDLKSEQIHVKSGSELMADPLDCVFGYTATSEEIHHSTPSSMSSRAQSRAHRRANRRRRMHHQEAPLGSHGSKYSKFDVE
ncbi:hypothetical protein F3Y22_tig00006753pilonHSYRG00053 [Hibiscus syriacus]|uniref:Uncharacterized protein n=1 Tax=Hibiscus syriacus TaxID=106335 RepID=A0A6A3CB75_HIBSY|nr:uncharacterized protein LOC120201039 [Hibiscus syriacus]KAE8726470.1 hypothetical protein F3Y22_tig00006753pilonHSYRG00053 [Hibiscus syriacus]